MAAKKVSKKKATKFIVGFSDCGDLSQLEIDNTETFNTLAAAQKATNESISNGDSSAEMTYYVLQVVSKGNINGVKWE